MELAGLTESAALETYCSMTRGPPGERFSQDSFLQVTGTPATGAHQLRLVSWLPATPPQAVVLICHGLHEHALRYYDMAHHLTARGVAVYACDHYAHGKSDGTRGLILDGQVLVQDFVEFAQHVYNIEGNSALPISLLAHSLGTLVGVLAVNKICKAGVPLAGVLFSGSALVSGPGASSPFGCQCLYPLTQTPVAACMTGCLASCDPKGPAAPILVEAITSDEEQRKLLESDPLQYHSDIMNKTAREALLLVNAVKQELPNILLPFKCVHGADDTITYPAGSTMIHGMAGTPAAMKSIDILPGLRHEVINEYPEAKAKSMALIGDYLVGIMLDGGSSTDKHQQTGQKGVTSEPQISRGEESGDV